jgi:hypothetical protein
MAVRRIGRELTKVINSAGLLTPSASPFLSASSCLNRFVETGPAFEPSERGAEADAAEVEAGWEAAADMVGATDGQRMGRRRVEVKKQVWRREKDRRDVARESDWVV